MSKLDLSDLEKNNLNNQSTPLKFENGTRIISEKLYEAIHLGSTSLLLINIEKYVCLFVCLSLTSLCHSNGHIETMSAREINPFTALTRIRSQFLRTQWSTRNHSEWTRLRLRPLSHRGWLIEKYVKMSQTWPFWPWQWSLERFNQILLFTVHCHHPGEASCQNREKVTEQILNKWTINIKIGEKWQI